MSHERLDGRQRNIERLTKAAKSLSVNGKKVSQSSLARELGLSRQRIGQIFEEYPDLTEELALINASRIRADSCMKAVNELQQEEQLLTIANIAGKMGVAKSQARNQITQMLKRGDLSSDLPIMSNAEFESFKIRVFAKTLRDFGLPVKYDVLADMLGKSLEATKAFLGRNPDLLQEIDIEYSEAFLKRLDTNLSYIENKGIKIGVNVSLEDDQVVKVIAVNRNGTLRVKNGERFMTAAPSAVYLTSKDERQRNKDSQLITEKVNMDYIDAIRLLAETNNIDFDDREIVIVELAKHLNREEWMVKLFLENNPEFINQALDLFYKE